MEERKELSEILLGNNKPSSSGKKAVFVVIAAIVIIAVVAFLVWKFLITKEEPLAQPSEIIDTSTMKPADDIFSSNFGTLDFGQDSIPGSSEAYTPSMPQDLHLGFEQEPIPSDKAETTDIDSALNNIEDVIAQAPKPTPKPESSPKLQAPKPQDPKPAQKPQPTPAQKPTEAPKPVSKPITETPKPKPESSPKPQSAPKPAAPGKSPAAANGSAPTRGFYWQVGAFEKEPNAEFLTLIKKYSYRIQHIVLDNKPNTRYLLGPYSSKDQAPSREEIAKIFKENPTPIEVP